MDADNMNPIVQVYIWAAYANICWHGTDGCRQYEPNSPGIYLGSLCQYLLAWHRWMQTI
jgi:hypothetical protein